MKSGLPPAPELNDNLHKAPSFPRKREPSVVDRKPLGTRFRGDDDDLNANVILYEARNMNCASSRWRN